MSVRLLVWSMVWAFLVSCSHDATGRSSMSAFVGSNWIHLYSEWMPALPDSGYLASASARVVRIEQDGRFSMTTCLLLKTATGIGVSRGDGQSFYFGYWTEQGGGEAKVEYVKVAEMVEDPRDGKPYERKFEALIVPDRSGSLALDGDVYSTLTSFADDEYRELVANARSVQQSKLATVFGR